MSDKTRGVSPEGLTPEQRALAAFNAKTSVVTSAALEAWVHGDDVAAAVSAAKEHYASNIENDLEKHKTAPRPADVVPPAVYDSRVVDERGPVLRDPDVEEAEKPEERQLRRTAEQLEFFEKRLAELNLTVREYNEIMDAMILEGEPFTKAYPLTGTLSVVFRTRTHQADVDINTYLTVNHREGANGRLLSHITWQHYLAHSLVRVGSTTFPSVRVALSWVQKLPAQLFAIYCNKLRDFDAYVSQLLDPELLENF